MCQGKYIKSWCCRPAVVHAVMLSSWPRVFFFYSAISEVISGPVGLEGVLWGALEKFYCSANKGISWFAEICEPNPDQITIHLNLYLHTFPKLGFLQRSKTSSTRDKWRGSCSLKLELFKTRNSVWKQNHVLLFKAVENSPCFECSINCLFWGFGFFFLSCELCWFGSF